jgi:hypothetical protein
MMAKSSAARGLLIDSMISYPYLWRISSWNSDKFYYVKLPKEKIGCPLTQIREELCGQIAEIRMKLGV